MVYSFLHKAFYKIKEENALVKEKVLRPTVVPERNLLEKWGYPERVTLEALKRRNKGALTKLRKFEKDPIWNIPHRLNIITLRDQMEAMMISLEVNGKHYEVDVSPDVPLLWVIREYLKLTGTKFGCGIGMCGSCTVHIDGKARRSCQIPLGNARGKRITTVEGLPEDHPIKRAWIEEQVPQCGYCQPGQIMQAAALLSKDANASEEWIIKGMDGILCRCGTYPRIKRAIKRAIEESNKL